MTTIVVDASVALAWCFPDESNDYADAGLLALEGASMLVPALWTLEVANAILVAERKKRLGQPEIAIFLTLLDSLAVTQDSQPSSEYMARILPIARRYQLSVYDASYLELAIRSGTRLATIDEKLARAAAEAGLGWISHQPPQ